MSDSLIVGLKFGRSAKLELRLPENNRDRSVGSACVLVT